MMRHACRCRQALFAALTENYRLTAARCLAEHMTMNLNLYLERVRDRLKVTPIGALAEACGVSRRNIERIRSGDVDPTTGTLQRIVDGMKVVKPAKKPAAKRPAAPSAAGATTRRQARSTATSASGDDAGSAGLGE